ncbi:MAG: sigma-54 dependent transcriptional regulator, partial [Bacteroidales bacterium]|nr:sigma-54 dependent transcriptional regulator [Bacteroidales bacterium]
FKILQNEKIELVICDFKLPEMNGLKVLSKIKEEFSDIEVIMISSSADMDTVIEALRKGAVDFFKKPFTAPELWVAIERTLKFKEVNHDLSESKKQHIALKNEYQKELGYQIIGSSAEIKTVQQQMKMVAQTPDTSVLIIGESGTGKELVARGIHELSTRNNQIFGAVNMSAIPENLFESEFFGHKKGSFTGAIADKAGWFETSCGGTLFLDEIGEMTLALQVKLLRVLEDRKFVKVGAQKEQQFDIRIVAATNKSVEQLTNGTDFRLDLFHRLGTFIIHLPALKERVNDIPELTEYFLSGLSAKMGKQIKKIHPDVYKLLQQHPFPGNIRELKNLVERAVIMCQGNEILPQHFGLQESTTPPLSEPGIENLFDLKELERRTILRALEKVNYNKAEAARLLNIEWNALYRRLQKYGIEIPKEV